MPRAGAPHERAQRAAAAPAPDALTPADRYQELFTAVQGARVFADSKTFVDCSPRADPAAIVDAYRAQRDAPGVPEQPVQACPIKAQSAAVAPATASICNAEWVRLGRMSGHGGFVHTHLTASA